MTIKPKFEIGTYVKVNNTYLFPQADVFAQLHSHGWDYRRGSTPVDDSKGFVVARDVYKDTTLVYGININGFFYAYVEKGLTNV